VVQISGLMMTDSVLIVILLHVRIVAYLMELAYRHVIHHVEIVMDVVQMIVHHAGAVLC
jgi:hypothetical protein